MMDFGNNKKRNWQCFVCGKIYNDLETFKEHIITTHEEGREFIICPLKRCKAPVRDMLAHFKAKHPTEKLPNFKQNKAVVWFDAKKEGEVKARKPKFRSGHFSSKKNGCDIPYRSGMECELYEILEYLPEVTKYEAEPFPVKYIFEGEWHNYIPDLQVQFSDGRIEIWEVKPSNQTNIPKNDAKWKAANNYAKTRNWEFMVLTEKGIDQLKKKAKLRTLKKE